MTRVDKVSNQIIGAAIAVHRKFGPGLLEGVYTACLGQELLESGLEVDVGLPIGLEHRNLQLKRAYVLDLRVEGCVIVEVKCVGKIADIHVAQLLTYLRLTRLPLGLIINFKVILLKNGIRRVVNNHSDDAGNLL